MASANSPQVPQHLLCVMFLCITPHSRSIGFRCGQNAGRKCSLIRRPRRDSHSFTSLAW